MAGALSRMAGRVGSRARSAVPVARSARNGMGGALGRVASRVRGSVLSTPPQPVKKNHMVSDTPTDRDVLETGEGLRRLVGKIASRGRMAAAKGGKIKSTVKSLRFLQEKIEGSDRSTEKSIVRKQEKLQRDLKRRGVDYEGDEDNVGTITRRPLKTRKYAEGGKVGSAMSALKQLAKEYKAAVMMDDKETADRIRRRMELVKPGSSKEVDKASDRSGRETKLATFSKGGKVRKLLKAFRARMDDREGYVREGFGETKEEAHANLRREVAHDNGEDVVDALMKEHGVTYSSRRKK